MLEGGRARRESGREASDGPSQFSRCCSLTSYLSKATSSGYGDQNFHLPQLQAELDSSLYPDSTAILKSTNEYPFFMPFFAVPARYLGLEWTFLLAYLVASAGFYFICFLLAEKSTGDRLAAYGFLLLMLPVTSVPETATLVWDTYLTHRGVVLPLCLLGVYHILNRKHVLAYFLFGVAALIHPMTAAAFAAACSGALAYDLWRKSISPQVVLLAGGAMLAGAGLLLWKLLTLPVGDSAFFSPPPWSGWRSCASERHICCRSHCSWDCGRVVHGSCSSCLPGSRSLCAGGRMLWSWRS